MSSSRPVDPDFLNRRRIWILSSLAWTIAGIAIAVAGLSAGLAITVYAASLSVDTLRFLGLISAGSGAILAMLNPIKKGNRFIVAWRLLDNACVRFKYNQASDESELIAAMARGEEIIGVMDDIVASSRKEPK